MKVAWAFLALLVGAVNAENPSEKDQLYQDGKTPAVEKIGEDVVPTVDQPKPPGTMINPRDMAVTCSSEQSFFYFFRRRRCANVLDSDVGTYWQNRNGAEESITVDLHGARSISGLVMVPGQNASSFIERHTVAISQDKKSWKEVAYGTWWPDNSEKLTVFQPENAQYLRLTIYQSDGPIAELNIYETEYIPPNPAKGAWGTTVDLPLVPVSGAVDPKSGELVLWASWQYNLYAQYKGGKTQTAIWNPYKRTVTQREVSDTSHDMFCTGIAFEENGNLLVNGGNTGFATSIYNTDSHNWTKGAKMNKDRGYEATTILSNGKIFTIGGSFSDSVAIKDGEVYDVDTNKWTWRHGASGAAIFTNDRDSYRMDNHAWIFGWKNESVFHAGPSQQMNWFGTNGDGTTDDAGVRGTDEDAMCGNAVMFDSGKILSCGGSVDYEKSPATDNAFVITIDEPRMEPSVMKAQNMKYKRTFHTSVVLPDGSVFVEGGQDFGHPFDESDSALEPERFIYNDEDPATSIWEPLQPNTIVRVYHSISLLLQDGTVFTGGGGLCGNCSANHFDGQIFVPPNLLNSDGTPRDRPEIVSVEPPSGTPGDTITVTTKGPIDLSASSLIRYGSATHTVNTDQRRLAVQFSDTDTDNQYTFQIPEEPGVAVPGYYMLYVLDDQGTPSVSKNVQVMSEK
ncbi:hypothetical protein FE257_010787 [Aspergillus nanangensis]|uniref:F5/8 type C domain-containing protein n=1 Tax=Aspergillus nanangensis TaxID=2582783 RepID=A0AAD4CVH5_ASPNN|nr:hypothetical protein FE257_010787 [Aspergillus nanangensis]